MNEKTIAAISTPVGVGGISIIRLSGKNALKIAKQVFSSPSKDMLMPRFMTLGTLKTPEFSEKCLAVYFAAPNSYTGEDMVEFQCHGGEKITEGILLELINKGASLAGPGEFTKRAFMNGKLSLDEAEGVIDVINAESEGEIRAGYNLMQGGLKEIVVSLQNDITNILAKIEVSLDYPEHDYEEEVKVEIEKIMHNIRSKVEELLASSASGTKIKSGVNVLILGSPNVGKSSLMNALLNYERAIVTNIKGTTRDLLKETYLYKGVKFVLTDTAGIRNSSGVEQIGVNLAKKEISSADIILFVVDGSKPMSKEDKDIQKLLIDKKYIYIVNKSDKKLHEECVKDSEAVLISAKNKTNIEALKELIYNEIFSNKIMSGVVITNMRHVEILQQVKDNIAVVLEDLSAVSLDLLAMDIKSVWLGLGEITGESNNEEIIDRIFSSFCVGK